MTSRRRFLQLALAGFAAAVVPWRKRAAAAPPVPAPTMQDLQGTWRNWAADYTGAIDPDTIESFRRGIMHARFVAQ